MNKHYRAFCLTVAVFCCFNMPAPASHASSGDAPDPLEKYRALLSNVKVAEAIYWEGSKSVGYFDEWDGETKQVLFDAILRLENGKPFPLQEPPEMTDSTKGAKRKIMSEEDAWTIYITHVAHSLWLEANHLVNWSIADYSQEELDLLLNSYYMFDGSPHAGYSFSSMSFGHVTDWNVEISYQFMTENRCILDDPLSTVYAFADWVRYHVKHYALLDEKETEEEAYNRIWGYSGYPPVDRILYPIKGGLSDSAGCWGTTGLFSAVMRSVNIAVYNNSEIQLGTVGMETVGYHSRLELPTLGIGLCHSDDLYGSLLDVRTGGAVVPIEKLFHTMDWLDEYMDNPKVLDESDTYKNRPEDQSAYNYLKSRMDLAIEYLTDGLLVLRADDAKQKSKPTRLKEYLTSAFAKPFYTDDEINAIVKKVDDKLIEIGNGSWKKGAAIVRKRVYG